VKSSIEDGAHIFFLCSKNVLCWQRTGLWSSTLMSFFDPYASFSKKCPRNFTTSQLAAKASLWCDPLKYLEA